MTTREAVLDALLTVAERAASETRRGRALRGQAEEIDLSKNDTLFIVADTDDVSTGQTLGRQPPYYITDSITIHVIVTATQCALHAAYQEAVAALDAALTADQSLGGLVKGLYWDSDGPETIDVPGASPERGGDITILAEYESASRLAV